MNDDTNKALPLKLNIERLNSYGIGVARHEGIKYFVPATLPGEEIEAVVKTKRKNALHCELIQVLVTSPKRVDPICPHFGVCGGCELQHISYDEQLSLKSLWVRDLFKSYQETMIHDIIPSPKPYAYRNRITLHHDSAVFGFHPENSPAIVDIRHCPIASDAVNQKLAKLTDKVLRGPKSFELREDGDATAFVQVNTSQNANLVENVVKLCKLRKAHRILELYAGSGNFTFELAKNSRSVLAIEGDLSAVNAALKRRKERGLKNPEFLHASAQDAVFRLVQELTRFDVVLCDPPREGLRGVAKLLPRLGAEQIVYVACEPRSLLRDAETLKRLSYRLLSITPLDMFPQTRHVELIAVFEKT